MNKEIILISLLLFSVIISVVTILIDINTSKKLKETGILALELKNKIGKDYSKDFTLLNEVIAQKMSYAKIAILPTMTGKNTGFSKDDDLTAVTSTITKNVIDALAEPYKDLLSFYVEDLELYVGNIILILLTDNFLKDNIKKVKANTDIKSIYDSMYGKSTETNK